MTQDVDQGQQTACVPEDDDRPHILVAEDDEDIRLALADALGELGHRATAVSTAESALQILEQSDVDTVLTDVRMPGMNGIELCRYVAGDRPGMPVIVMTAFGDVQAAVDALRAGAIDFITKPFETARLAEVVDRALEQRRLNSGVARLTAPNVPDHAFRELVGSSGAMERLRREIAQVAASESTVLIMGESGTGKELVARALHSASRRHAGPFVAVDCCAVPHEILEAELFGYVKGAFTGAERSRLGLFIEAANGTLFLDEVGDMPLALQPKLLRALQERTVRPVGSSRETPFNARIIAASNRDMGRAVQSGEFRIDLWHRLDVLNISVPALRNRERDVIEIAKHFMARLTDEPNRQFELTRAAEQHLLNCDWPGNVRELENCISAAAAMASDYRIGVEELPEDVRSGRARPVLADGKSIEMVERHHIEAVLNAVGWNKVIAAKTLGIDRATLYRKLMRLGLQGPSDPGKVA